MPIVVGITLRTAGKIYFFDPGTDKYLRDERVLVETARGPELGTIKLPPHEVRDDEIVPPLKQVVRRVTAADLTRDTLNREREAHALEACKRLITKFNLPMRLIDAQYTFDASHVLIHFLADNRVDFRELVRELAHELHTRIELRQVGVRDEAKLLGGYGVCGRILCCASFLTNFAPVAINLAKEQGLALNPQKISGMCGRLMCCLTYEHECYKQISAELPHVNATLETPRGTGKVTKLNVLARQVEVMIPELPTPVWFSMDELNGTAPKVPAGAQGGCCGNCARTAEAPLDFPELEGIYADEEPVAVEASTNEQPQHDTTPEQRKRPRRRRKRPAGEPGSAQQPVASAQPADGQPAANKPRHSRNHKPRPKPAPAEVPVGVAAPTAATAQPDPNRPPKPSGRYRPRRRRGPQGPPQG